MTGRDLENFLNVDVLANLLASDPRARRAGFARSGVSGQNRLIERHPLKAAGAYWRSYDFKASTWEANLLQFPLGPRFARNPFPDLAFAHDGGENIFHLPNGLQGYLLVNGKDERIDAGPIEVVSDALKTSGTPVIVNGLSCMACHKHGMIPPPADLVRDGAGVFGRARERVRLLYPEGKEMDRLVQRDADQFLRALDEVVGPFLRVGPDKERPVKELPEPIGEVARKYLLEDPDLVTAPVSCSSRTRSGSSSASRTARTCASSALGPWPRRAAGSSAGPGRRSAARRRCSRRRASSASPPSACRAGANRPRRSTCNGD
jgi:serine/threonine-protein kinase